MTLTKGRKIVAFVEDSPLRQLVEKTAAELEAEVVWKLDATQVIKQVAEMRPLLIFVHLDLLDDVKRIIQTLKTSPATRRIPVIAFDYHANEELIRHASTTIYQDLYFDVGADALTENSPPKFLEAVRSIGGVTDSDRQVLFDQCDQSMTPLVKKGLEEFNAGEYYECHETLETAWMQESGPVRDVYRGILQIAIAYYQLQRGNYNGAMKLFLRSLQWLEPLPDQCQGIDLAQFRADALQARLAMETLGSDHIKDFDQSLLKPITYDL